MLTLQHHGRIDLAQHHYFALEQPYIFSPFVKICLVFSRSSIFSFLGKFVNIRLSKTPE